MNMLGGLLGGLFDKEEETKKVIQETLKSVTEELNCSPNEIFITIKAANEECEPRLDVFQTVNGKPTHIRPITLKEVLGIEEEE